MGVLDVMSERLQSALVLAGSGVIELSRPDRTVLAARDVRSYGPIAGPTKAAVRRTPHKLAVVDANRALTYRELDRRTDALAIGLTHRGVGTDSTVATLCRDHCGLVEMMVATGKIGARLILLNTALSVAELDDVCRREEVDVVALDADLAAKLGPHMCGLTTVTVDSGKDSRDSDAFTLVARHLGAAPPPAPHRPGELVSLTGGTTGTPKGVGRSVRSPLVAAQFLDRIPLPCGGTTYLAAPLFHGTSLSQFVLSMSLSTTTLLCERFVAEDVLREVDRYRCTTLVLVPTMLRRILALGPDVLAGFDTSSLAVIFCAGSALSVATGDAAIAHFGPVLYNLYGSSEVGVVAVAGPTDWIAAPGTVGRPPRGVRVALYDDDCRRIDEPGVAGTVYAGSALSFDGYSGGGDKASVHGLLSSGDVGHWDEDGRLFIDGRDDDMIVSGGENVFPGEIEDLLYRHPQIVEAAIVAVDDDDFGQRLAAYVVREKLSQLTGDDVRDYVRDNLARFKVPRDVLFIEELPRTPSGKLLRRALHGMDTR